MLNLVFFRVLRKLELNLSVDRERQNIVFSVCNSIIVHCLVLVVGDLSCLPSLLLPVSGDVMKVI